MNEVLRQEYVKDSERALARWNKYLGEEGASLVTQLTQISATAAPAKLPSGLLMRRDSGITHCPELRPRSGTPMCVPRSVLSR